MLGMILLNEGIIELQSQLQYQAAAVVSGSIRWNPAKAPAKTAVFLKGACTGFLLLRGQDGFKLPCCHTAT